MGGKSGGSRGGAGAGGGGGAGRGERIGMEREGGRSGSSEEGDPVRLRKRNKVGPTENSPKYYFLGEIIFLGRLFPNSSK